MMRLALLAAVPLFAEPRFERDILPIFTANCFSCHGGTAMAGLDLRTAASVMKGSHEGPVVAKGDTAKSLLFEKVSKRLMPPPAFNLKLTDAQIDTVKQWIEAGAPSDQAEAHATRWKEQTAHFEKEALPVFKAKCAPCHLSDKPMAGLDLRTLASTIKGTANGPVIEEGVADKSIMIRQISRGAMPPKGSPQLTPEEVSTLRRWIDTTRFGAREISAERTTFTPAEAPNITHEQRQWWAFRKPVKAAVPNSRAKRPPIDAFVLAKLEPKGLTLSPEAPMPTLIRRAYLDLIGLPPTPAQIDAVLADTKPGAYERMVDRLLDSPHYGERWGRHWLDAAGYSDAAGFDNCFPVVELHDGMWRYRDYVVDSFNKDKPYDRFLVEQLAGDELHDWRNAASYTPEMLEALTATGYLRSVYDRTDADIVNLIGERHDVLFHLMEKVSTHLMGVTVGCARCHTHKFDPIPQRDYYRMMAVFTPAFNPVNWKQPKNRYLATVAKPEEEAINKHNADIDKAIERLRQQLAKVRKPYEERLLTSKLAAVPELLRADVRTALDTPDDKRDDVQKYLAGKFARGVRPSADELEKVLNRDDAASVRKIEEQIKTHEGYKRSFDKVQALWDVGPAPKTRLLQRGAVESPGPRVGAGVPEVLWPTDFTKPPDAKGETTGMRLAFARWLASRENPLAARVLVNRVWQDHFGRGIVETSENFGKMGTGPTHPELLDWLAVDFMEHGWSMKRLHRQVMTSAVYRQVSRQEAEAAKLDPDNKLLWRMNLRRLEAEAVRDSVLAASGKLDTTPGGKPVMLKTRTDGLQDLVDNKNRRSLYVMSRRNHPFQFLQVFDFPTIQVNCTRRSRSATPLQSLAMLNDDFMVESAAHMAERAPDIATAYRIALSRPPSAEEARLARDFVAKQEELYRFSNLSEAEAKKRAKAEFCQMLLSSNEFLYVD